jgi:hypothetical protein
MFCPGPLVLSLALLGADGDAPPPNALTLFNGKNLSGWVIEGAREYKDASGKVQPNWKVEQGLLACAGKGFGFLRYDRQKFADFHFHVEYRMAARGNSGIGIRTIAFDPRRSMQTRPSMAAYEVQLLDDAGSAPSKKGTGSLYRYVAPTKNTVRPAGQWNVADIRCVGSNIEVNLNGERILAVNQETIEEIRMKPLVGYVCLQSHTYGVTFRNVWIEEIKAAR